MWGGGGGRVHALAGLVARAPNPSCPPAWGSAQTLLHADGSAGRQAPAPPRQGGIHSESLTHSQAQPIPARHANAQAHGLCVSVHTGPEPVCGPLTHTHTGPWFACSPPAQDLETKPAALPGGADLGQVVAEAVAVATVRAELAQGHDADRALGEAAGVVCLDGRRDQGIKVLLGGQLPGRRAWGETGSSHPNRRGQGSWTRTPHGARVCPSSSLA